MRNSDGILNELKRNLTNIGTDRNDFFNKIIDVKTRYSSLIKFVKVYGDSKLITKINTRTFNKADLIIVVNLIIRPNSDQEYKVDRAIQELKECEGQEFVFDKHIPKNMDIRQILFERVLYNLERLNKLTKGKYNTSAKSNESSMFCLLDISICLTKLESEFRSKYPRIPWILIEFGDYFYLSDNDAIIIYQELIEKLNYKYEIESAYQQEFNKFDLDTEGRSQISTRKSIRTVRSN